MSDSNLSYLGAPAKPHAARTGGYRLSFEKLPWPFLVVVVLPTVLTALYYLLIASPQYVSEARFIVRSAERAQPNSLGLVLQGVGLSAAQGDAFAVHEYMISRDAVDELKPKIDIARVLSRPGADFLARFPQPWGGRTDTDLHKNFQRFLTVGYNSSTGISTLRVKAFTPRDAQKVTDELLHGGERLVNRLNERAASNTVLDAERTLAEAETRLASAQTNLTGFRNREGIIDPEASAEEGAEVITGLAGRLAGLRADRAQLAADAPNSPLLANVDSQIRAYENELAAQRAKMAGNANSLAPKISRYEALALDRELADKGVAAARTALDSAHEDARRQRLYLERVVNPSLPDKADEPRRLRAILLVLVTSLLIYGLGWLILAGVREHRQD